MPKYLRTFQQDSKTRIKWYLVPVRGQRWALVEEVED